MHCFWSGFVRVSGCGDGGEDEKLKRKGRKGEATDRERFGLEPLRTVNYR